MKRRLFALPVLLVLLAVLTVPALAAGTQSERDVVPVNTAKTSAFPLVTDEADLLTAEQEKKLSSEAESVSKEYQCNVYLYLVQDMDSNAAKEYAKSVYQKHALGYGTDKSGIMLMMSMEDRDYALIAYGYGNTALTDHGRDVLLDDEVLPQLKEDRYYEGFTTYLSTIKNYFNLARAGKPFDVDTDQAYLAEKAHKTFLYKLAACILIPLVITVVFCLISYAKMKTVRPQCAADCYIPEGGCHVTYRDDQFLYQTEARVRIKSDDSGNGGTTIDSDGFSGSSGKF